LKKLITSLGFSNYFYKSWFCFEGSSGFSVFFAEFFRFFTGKNGAVLGSVFEALFRSPKKSKE